MRRHRQGLWAWIAIVAILAATLLPSVGRTTGIGGSDLLHEICFGSGTSLSVDELRAAGFSLTSDEAPQPMLGLDHCPFCCGHAVLAVLPATPPEIPLMIADAAFFPWLFYAAPQPLFIWSPSLARAPPAVS